MRWRKVLPQRVVTGIPTELGARKAPRKGKGVLAGKSRVAQPWNVSNVWQNGFMNPESSAYAENHGKGMDVTERRTKVNPWHSVDVRFKTIKMTWVLRSKNPFAPRVADFACLEMASV
jgi:hypothetical protein